METNLIADIMPMALLAEFSVASLLDSIGNLTKMALGIGFVIFIHELGHFLAAKACGVKCEKFYVGFDPPMKYLPSALFKFQWGETEYGLGIIPLGGYVKMLGQDDNPGKAQEEAERSKVVTTTPDGKEHVAFDPRSYVAKSVPQRMLIISAGVIMNLISAVFIAAFAFKAGVTIEPVRVGVSSPGDPAWVHNMTAGDKVLQVNRRDEEVTDEYLRWRWDFMKDITKAGISKQGKVHPMDLKIRDAAGKERWESFLPTDRKKDLLGVVSVGVGRMGSNRIPPKAKLKPFLAAGKAEPPIEPGDRIIAVNGESLPKDEINHLGNVPAYALQKAFVERHDEPITLTLERSGKDDNGKEKTELVDSVVPASPWKSLGLVMKIGPIVGIRIGSTGETAGFEEGDELLTIQGEPVGNPLTLPFRMPSEETISVVVRRKGKEQTIEVKQDFERWNAHFDGLGARVALETIGVAYHVTNTVADVIPDSPAAKADLQKGDRVVVMQLMAADAEAHKAAIARMGKKYNDPTQLDDEVFTWPYIVGIMQQAGPGINFRITRERGQESKESIELAAFDLPNQHYPIRGLIRTLYADLHKAESWGDAFRLGFRETKEKMVEVWDVLTMLVKGELALNNLGGPLLIATVASSEASMGIPRLLLFLTFLSANLAILNFLPIPVLDGGHMVFLIWEGVLGRPVPERIQHSLTFIGFCMLMALMVFVFTNDIARMFGG